MDDFPLMVASLTLFIYFFIRRFRFFAVCSALKCLISSCFFLRVDHEPSRSVYSQQQLQPGSSIAVLHKDALYSQQQPLQQTHGTQSPHLSKLHAGAAHHTSADTGPQAYKRPRLNTEQMRTDTCPPLTIETQIKQVTIASIYLSIYQLI